MGFRNEIEEILKVQSRGEKTERIEEIVFDLSSRRSVAEEEVGETAAILVQAALGEQNKGVKGALFDLLATIVRWYRIDRLIDWDAILAQIPSFTGKILLFALEMLGWSRDQRYIPLLERYLDSPNIWVQITALEAIAQIWWDLSEKSDEMRKYIKIEAIGHIQSLLNNPQTHHLPEALIQKQLSQVQYEFIEHMRKWFEVNGENASL